jgi:hypothetical protein
LIPTPQEGPVLPSVLHFYKKAFLLFKIAIQGVSLHLDFIMTWKKVGSQRISVIERAHTINRMFYSFSYNFLSRFLDQSLATLNFIFLRNNNKFRILRDP